MSLHLSINTRANGARGGLFGSLLLASLVLVGCGHGDRLEVPSPGEENYTSLDPVAIHAVSTRELIVTGSLTRKDGTPEGLILSTSDAGKTWRRLGVEVHDLRRVTFQDVFYADRLRGWVGGVRVDVQGRARPTVFRTEDGGNRWRETALVQDPEAVVSEVHSLAFVSDTDGTVGVTMKDPKTGATRETLFITDDGGRSWTASQYREKPRLPFHDQTTTMVDERRGFRLARSRYPGVTNVEATISQGQDWMPVAELSLGALSTYY